MENQELVCTLLTTKVAGKEIRNDDKVLDLLNYAIGTLKCFTQTNKAVQEETIQSRMIPILALCVEKILKIPVAPNKKAMILVQITGTLRNLANVDSSHLEISRTVVRRMCDIFFD